MFLMHNDKLNIDNIVTLKHNLEVKLRTVKLSFIEVCCPGRGMLIQCSVFVQFSAVLYSAVQYCTVQCSIVQFSAVLYSAVQHFTVQCSIVQCSAVLYSAVHISKAH